MNETKGLLQIGEFAKRAGTNLRTLRYYEELGLLVPAARSDGGFRFYREDQLDRMHAIRRLQDLGLSLKEIAKAIRVDGETTGKELVARLRPVLEKQIVLAEARIQQLKADLEELNASRARLLELCQGCDLPFSKEHCDPCPRDSQPIPAVIRALL